MLVYSYKALDAQGQRVQGELEAIDKLLAGKQLRARGLIVLSLKEETENQGFDLLSHFKRPNSRDLTVLTRQLATMINAGMPLLRCLYSLEEQVTNEQLVAVILDVRKRVEAGESFSDALSHHPKVFNELYIAMVKAGEIGGILDDTLLRVADQLEKSDSLHRQIKAAMIYPTLIGSFAMIVLIAMVAFLIPVFEKVLLDVDPSGGKLPLITRVSIGASHLITGSWYLLIVVVVGIVVGFRRWKNSSWGHVQWDKFKLHIPMRIGPLVQKIALARFSRTFSGLVAGGVPMLETINITGRTAGNAVIEQAMSEVHDSVHSGGTLARPLQENPDVFPAMIASMVEIGEDSGTLEVMMEKIADFYEDEVAAAVKGLSAILEPIMLIFIGVVVGFIVISMYLPLFDLYDKIR